MTILSSYVLLLGEADFSFTESMVRGLQQNESELTSWHVFSTCFDMIETASDKYRTLPGTLKTLNKASKHMPHSGSVTVTFNIDAMTSPLHSLFSAVPTNTATRTFDDIIFNFPHIGTESTTRNSGLVGHFAANALPCLTRPGGGLHISLSREQHERWNIQDVMALHGLVKVEERAISPGIYKGTFHRMAWHLHSLTHSLSLFHTHTHIHKYTNTHRLSHETTPKWPRIQSTIRRRIRHFHIPTSEATPR